MKIHRCLPVVFLCLLLGILTACASGSIEANPLPTLAHIAPVSPAVDLPTISAPLPTPLALATHEVQQPTTLASSTATQFAPATSVSTIPLLPTSNKPATLSPITPAVSTPLPLASPTAVVCKHQWFFTQPNPTLCPVAEALASYAVIQPFEHGQMIWVEETDNFYVMFNAGAFPNTGRQAYLSYTNIQLRPGASVDNRVGEPAPAGLYEPVNGFGLIWRNEIEGADLAFVRPSLGWATKPEEGFNTQIQSDQLSIFSFYLLSPQNTVFYFSWTHYIGSMWSEFTPNGLK